MEIGDRIKILCEITKKSYFLLLSQERTYTEELWGKIIKIDNENKEVLVEWENAPFDTSKNWVKMRNIL